MRGDYEAWIAALLRAIEEANLGCEAAALEEKNGRLVAIEVTRADGERVFVEVGIDELALPQFEVTIVNAESTQSPHRSRSQPVE